MTPPEDAVRMLGPGQVFFDYGPVSMVVSAQRGGDGDTALCQSAFTVIHRCLEELRPALALLRQFPAQVDTEALSGAAQTMARAVKETGDPYLTPMAAVAGTISDAVADYLQGQGAERATANNGGDVALRLGHGQSLRLGVRYDLGRGDGHDRVITLMGDRIGGVATSGMGGRSLTTGIASGVTAFSRRCADADALATLLANRSYLPCAAVHTALAGELDPDSDIASLTVVTGVDPLTTEEKEQALAQVMAEAKIQYRRGGLAACIATVQGQTLCFDPEDLLTQ